MVPRLWMDEPNSRFLPQDWSPNCICPISIPTRIHRHRSHSLRSHLGLFVGANLSYRGGKVDIRLPPGLRLNKILTSIPCWKMRCILCLVDNHVYSVAGRGRCNLITPVRSCDPSRGHTPL